jgi:hypothetical protein
MEKDVLTLTNDNIKNYKSYRDHPEYKKQCFKIRTEECESFYKFFGYPDKGVCHWYNFVAECSQIAWENIKGIDNNSKRFYLTINRNKLPEIIAALTAAYENKDF